jgi:FAS-associated factor 2
MSSNRDADTLRRRATGSGAASGVNDEPRPRTPDNNNQVSLIDGLFRLISFPITFLADSLLSLIQFAWSLITGGGRQNAIDPTGDVIKFIELFEAKYGLVHPQFYRGTYGQALAEAKKDLNFLVVYLHSDHHQDTDEFCSKVLTHQEISSYVTRNNLTFWACSVNYPEGHRASQALREHTYPFLALIGLKENRMTVVRRFEGKTTVERLLSQIDSGISANEHSLVAARSERNERSMNQQIRNEQDEAYLESLKADQEKEQKRKEEQAIRDAAEKAQQDKVNQELDVKERLLKLKGTLGAKVPSEPDTGHENSIRVLVKLPNGTRLERRFVRSDSIKYLVYFVFSHDQSPLNFQVTTNFPRKELPCKPPTLDNPDCDIIDESGKKSEPVSFECCGLGKSEMLFVHDLEA